MAWIEVCPAAKIGEEEVIRFDYGTRSFAVYRGTEDDYYATDGFCTHEAVHLAGGLVMDGFVECPKHNGRFDYRTGQARGAPVCIDLKSYPVKVDAGLVLIDLV